MVTTAKSILLLKKSKHSYIGISDKTVASSRLFIYMPSVQDEPIWSESFTGKNIKSEFEKRVKSYASDVGESISDVDLFREYVKILKSNGFGITPVMHDLLYLLELSKTKGVIEKTIGGYDEITVETAGKH